MLVIYSCLAPANAAVSPATNSVPTTETSERQLSLSEAKRTAYERNWDLLAAKSGIDNSTAQLIVAHEFPNPTVSLSTAKIGTHDSSTTLGNGVWSRSYDTIAAVSQLIEIAGKRGSRQAAARAGVTGARARFHDARRTLDQGVTRAYVAVLLAEDNVGILNESAGYLLREAEIAEARFKAGDISESDRNQIEINANQFELQAKAAESTAKQARVAVEILMGVPHPTGNWKPSDSLDQLAGTPPPANEPEAGGVRSDVLAAEADLKSSKANLRLQKALRIPDPTFAVQVEHNPPGGGPAVDTFGVGVSFPLPIWNRNGGNIKAAQAAVKESETALGKIQTQAAADIANAEFTYSEAFARLQRYRDQIRPKSTRVRESVAFAYNKGGASLVDLLDAERTDNDVRLATAQAMSDTASAVADLTAARKVLSEKNLNSDKY